LDRFKISIGEDEELVVEKSEVFKIKEGIEPYELYPDSVLNAWEDDFLRRLRCAGSQIQPP
jgi:hypothetical protein